MDLSFFEDKKNMLDNLTGLYERQVIISYMNYLISNNIEFTFAILDVDNFKFVNDNYGHLVGDVVLKKVANTIKDVVKDYGIVGRYGGDEFIFVFPNIQKYEDAWQCGFNVLKSTNNMVIPEAKSLIVSYTIGMSRFPFDHTNIDELFAIADKALYRGKIKGRNCFIIYLKEKHQNIDLLTKRDKIYTLMHLNNKVYTMLMSDEDTDKKLSSVLAFVGSALMLEHICIETKTELKYDYYHPLSKRTDGYYPYGFDLIAERTDSNGFYCENVIFNKKEDKTRIFDKFNEQNIYSVVLCRIKAYEKMYGYLRVDMVATNTGRIWQENDLVLLNNMANYIGLMLYSKNKEI